jgi:hypothetical protein
MTDDDLDALIGEAREHIEAEGDDVAPDFASMIAAAHERDPEQVPHRSVAEAETLAPVLELHATPPPTGADAWLDALLDDARSAAETDVAARRLAPIPAPPSVLARATRHEHAPRRTIAVMAALGLLAGLAIALPRLLERFTDAARSEATNKHQAEFQDQPHQVESAEQLPPRMQRIDDASEAGEAITMQGPREQMPVERVATERVATERVATERVPTERVPTERAPEGPSLEQRVAALDDEAQRRWAAGELEAAEEAFRAIIKLAGKGRHADLAYGDLFTLTHQRHDDAAELALWREYLRRFPTGRFADDARAGVCRRGPQDERVACWQAYLADFPTGLHRHSAERALEPDAP